MKKLFIILFLLFSSILFFLPKEVNGEANVYFVTQNIKNIKEFLLGQEYFDDISKICHYDYCYSIDVHDLNRSIDVVEKKVLNQISMTHGKEKATEVALKGFSITKILTR